MINMVEALVNKTMELKMKLSLEYKKKFFWKIARMLEKSRKEKGWSVETASVNHGITIRRLIQLEYASGGHLQTLPLSDLMTILSRYDKGLEFSLVDLQNKDADPNDNEERQREWVLKQLEIEAQKEAAQAAADNI